MVQNPHRGANAGVGLGFTTAGLGRGGLAAPCFRAPSGACLQPQMKVSTVVCGLVTMVQELQGVAGQKDTCGTIRASTV